MTSSTILLVLHVKHCVLGEIMNIYVEILHVLLLHVSPTSRFFCRHYMSFFAEFEDFFVWFEELHVGTFFVSTSAVFSLLTENYVRATRDLYNGLHVH